MHPFDACTLFVRIVGFCFFLSFVCLFVFYYPDYLRALTVELCHELNKVTYPPMPSQEQQESGEFEDILYFILKLNNPNGSPVSITQAQPESG